MDVIQALSPHVEEAITLEVTHRLQKSQQKDLDIIKAKTETSVLETLSSLCNNLV